MIKRLIEDKIQEKLLRKKPLLSLVPDKLAKQQALIMFWRKRRCSLPGW